MISIMNRMTGMTARTVKNARIRINTRTGTMTTITNRMTGLTTRIVKNGGEKINTRTGTMISMIAAVKKTITMKNIPIIAFAKR